MSPEIKELLEYAINELEEIQGASGCNDLELPNTPEIKKLWKEYNVWNCEEATNSEHDQWMPLSKLNDNELLGNDGFLVFLLRKHLNLL